MRIFAASDIHMGDGSARDDFLPLRQKFLDSIPNPAPEDAVVLVGDVLDGTRYGINACLRANTGVLANLGVLKPWWVVGNHDEAVWRHRKLLSEMGFRLVDRMLLAQGDHLWYICHGHEWDPANKKGSWTGKAATGVANVVGKLWPKAEDWLARQAQKLDGTGRYDQGSFPATVDAFLREFEGVGGVIAGHTHVREQRTSAAGKRYVNTGTWPTHGWTVVDLRVPG